MNKKVLSDFSMCLVGEAGQGITSVETILVALAKQAGFHVFATKEYMSRVRGGVNSTSIRLSRNPVSSVIHRTDLIILFSKEGLTHIQDRIGESTITIADDDAIGIKADINVPFSSIAGEIGNRIFQNTVAAGLVAGILSLNKEKTMRFVSDRFASKGEAIKEKNSRAVAAGYEIGSPLAARFHIEKPGNPTENITISGADSIALGALAGGCDYVCGYPMSPATGVLERLAKYSLTHNIISEQVEDEIGVINMALGAAYAGARPLVSTSGGGFALMGEGISLSGMIETPVVVHLAQRPGPATGLPTRTEQGDLNLVLYAGHGDFPRLIFAPGTLEEGFFLTAKALELADRFQVPAFVLTDQYFVDTYYDVPPFSTTGISTKRHIVKTSDDYKRFTYTKDGISPRGIPGYGEGIVCVDSDEHNEGGYIIEDATTRVKMTNKRLIKNKTLVREFIPPTMIGPANAKTVIVTWGSTFPMARDALAAIAERNPDNSDSIALLHFSQVYPLPDLSSLFSGRQRFIAVENNTTGQFADLLEKYAAIRFDARILKYDGRPFTVEELTERLETLFAEGAN
ncbi:MAG TPA: 2-oxoacid:acceptor oxidoreductase subunit alpha [Treponema sp.]|nr:2-oxoacid:acceptor oxidoreductase subunit alpha [Treponema sp.]